jgi:hypothetical protein
VSDMAKYLIGFTLFGIPAAALLLYLLRDLWFDWRADKGRTAAERLYLRYGVLLSPDDEAANDPSDPRWA